MMPINELNLDPDTIAWAKVQQKHDTLLAFRRNSPYTIKLFKFLAEKGGRATEAQLATVQMKGWAWDLYESGILDKTPDKTNPVFSRPSGLLLPSEKQMLTPAA
jgi:hypothetical protein